jgi:hypothetical protein
MYLHPMNKLSLFVLGISFIACTEITFKEPQPKGIKALAEFPGSLQGKYIVPQDSGSEKFDTVYIESTRYRINSLIKEGEWMNRGVLSDSLALKNYKGFYFLNFYTDEQWVVRVFKQEKNGNIQLYEINLSDDEAIKKLTEAFQPEVIKKDNSTTYYRIDPTPKDYLKFIKENYSTQEPMRKIQ